MGEDLNRSASPVLPQNAVVVNGAAVNLITTLVESVRTDMRAMEERITDNVNDRFDTHEESHETMAEETHGFRSRTKDRLSKLEKEQSAVDRSAAVKEARRDGQLSFVKGLLYVLDKYGNWVALGIVVTMAIIGATVGGFEVRFGP